MIGVNDVIAAQNMFGDRSTIALAAEVQILRAENEQLLDLLWDIRMADAITLRLAGQMNHALVNHVRERKQ